MIRNVTESTFNNLMLDMPLTPAGYVDFGVETDGHYALLQQAVREGTVTIEDLDKALGNGSALTEIARKQGSNIVFRTPYDMM